MNPSHPNPSDNGAPGEGMGIERAAAEWLLRHEDGLSAEQEARFADWIRQDRRHAEVYAEMDETWGLLDRMREMRPDALAAPAAAFPRAGRKFAWMPAALAAAAAIAVIFAGALEWRLSRPRADFAETAATDVGLLRKLTLPDGSVVQLNTDSAIEVNFSPSERRVRLVRGEANFAVAKNPRRPFIVSAGGVAVRAVGTAFNVRLRPDAVEVLVTEGKVRVDDAAKGGTLLTPHAVHEEPLLVAGQRVLIATPRAAAMPAPAPMMAVAPVEIERALAWREQRLEFVAAPLSDMVAEFNRYNRHKLAIVDPELAKRRFGGTFQPNDPETLVRLLETRFGVGVERRGNETMLGSGR